MRWGLEGRNGDAVADCEAVTAAVEREGVGGGMAVVGGDVCDVAGR